MVKKLISRGKRAKLDLSVKGKSFGASWEPGDRKKAHAAHHTTGGSKPTREFLDFRHRVRNKPTKFKTDNYVYKTTTNKRTHVKMKWAVAKAPSGCAAWRVVGRA